MIWKCEGLFSVFEWEGILRKKSAARSHVRIAEEPRRNFEISVDRSSEETSISKHCPGVLPATGSRAHPVKTTSTSLHTIKGKQCSFSRCGGSGTTLLAIDMRDVTNGVFVRGLLGRRGRSPLRTFADQQDQRWNIRVRNALL